MDAPPAKPTSSSQLRFPCGHVHAVTFAAPEGDPHEIGGLLQVQGCEQATEWAQVFALYFLTHVQRATHEAQKGADRQARLWKDLEMAFNLVREFGGLYCHERAKREDAEAALAWLSVDISTGIRVSWGANSNQFPGHYSSYLQRQGCPRGHAARAYVLPVGHPLGSR
ncbi:hypothetical protein C2E23DRAFT_857618 [Lenzites betulinus]|nr:hypothetical protein C2E23DRAFT_857618 [Lenzites betulinus]